MSERDINNQGIKFRFNNDVSWNSAPLALQQAVLAAYTYYSRTIFVPTVVGVQLFYENLGAGVLASTSAAGADGVATYAQLRQALIRNARSNVAQNAVSNSFPASDPINPPDGFLFTRAHARILGFLPPWESGAADIQHQFNSAQTWYFENISSGGGPIDAYNCARHEASEGLGRQFAQNAPLNCYPLNYLRYASAGTRQITNSPTASPSYFSLDGGVTNLHAFNTGGSGDIFDWASSTPQDAFDWQVSGGVMSYLPVDGYLLDAIGMSSVPNPP